MKKIMFALVVGLIAASVQANFVDWGLSSTAGSTYYAGSADLSSFTAYLIQASDWTGALSDLDSKVASTSWVTSKDTGSARQYKTATPVTSATTLTAGDYSFYVVLSDGAQYWASAVQTATVYEEGSTDPNNKSISIVLSAGTAITTSSLQPLSGVPEPTSALLFMLGGAMLALRRRRV